MPGTLCRAHIASCRWKRHEFTLVEFAMHSRRCARALSALKRATLGTPVCPKMSHCKLIAMDVLYGIHAVEEALLARSRSLDHVEVARERHDQRLQAVIDLARKEGISLR